MAWFRSPQFIGIWSVGIIAASLTMPVPSLGANQGAKATHSLQMTVGRQEEAPRPKSVVKHKVPAVSTQAVSSAIGIPQRIVRPDIGIKSEVDEKSDLYNLLDGLATLNEPRPNAFTQTDPMQPTQEPLPPKQEPVPVEVKPRPIVGTANRITVPSVAIDIAVQSGSYDSTTNSWQVDDSSAFHADTTVPVNDTNGATLIYGHAKWGIFGNLPDVRAGAEATVYTTEGMRFVYMFESAKDVNPSDVSMLTSEGAPRLILQTCSGLFDQHRTLVTFRLKEVIQGLS